MSTPRSWANGTCLPFRVRGAKAVINFNSTKVQDDSKQQSLLLHHSLNQTYPRTALKMASIIGRTAFRATRPLRASGVTAGAESTASQSARDNSKSALKQGARKDPELYVCRHSWILLSLFS